MADLIRATRLRWLPLALAATWTLLNAVKPLHVDDATFYHNAAQIAHDPFDPYGFALMRWDQLVPANHALAPPVLPYYWALGIRLFGNRPILWKLWLFPFVLLLAVALRELLARFARGWESSLLLLMIFSPVFLPGLNLMMDIPALALSLGSLVFFQWAGQRDSLPLAALAGLTAGLAMQTKYTAMLTPAVMIAYAVVFRKRFLGIYAVALAVFIFVGWEVWVACRYGESHFLYQLSYGDNSDEGRINMARGLCTILGAVAPALLIFGLAALRIPRWLGLVAGFVAATPYVLLGWPATGSAAWYEPKYEVLPEVFFGLIGAGVLMAVGAVGWRLAWPNGRGSFSRPFADDPSAAFLVLWFALELVGYFTISPFPAVRRLMGPFVPATLIMGRMAGPNRLINSRLAAGAVAASTLLGLGFFLVDYQEAVAEQQAAERAAALIHSEHSAGTIWYVGYWGLQFYAERAGMKQAVPLYHPFDKNLNWPSPSHFHSGDWLVIPSANVAQQTLYLDQRKLDLVWKVPVTDPLPLGTLDCYYAGTCPLHRQLGPRIVLRVFRVKAALVPLPPPAASGPLPGGKLALTRPSVKKLLRKENDLLQSYS
jgi:hypothetical protein